MEGSEGGTKGRWYKDGEERVEEGEERMEVGEEVVVGEEGGEGGEWGVG